MYWRDLLLRLVFKELGYTWMGILMTVLPFVLTVVGFFFKGGLQAVWKERQKELKVGAILAIATWVLGFLIYASLAVPRDYDELSRENDRLRQALKDQKEQDSPALKDLLKMLDTKPVKVIPSPPQVPVTVVVEPNIQSLKGRTVVFAPTSLYGEPGGGAASRIASRLQEEKVVFSANVLYEFFAHLDNKQRAILRQNSGIYFVDKSNYRAASELGIWIQNRCPDLVLSVFQQETTMRPDIILVVVGFGKGSVRECM